jgi:hypothetical protein
VDQKKTKNQQQHRHDRSVLERIKKHTKWIDHTKSMAVSVRTLLAVALHQYVQRHFEDYSESCTASVAWLNRPNFDWQARENDSQALVAASVLDLQNRKNIISTARHDQKKNSMELPRKRTKKKIEMCRNLTFDTLCITEVIHKCQRLHARFPVGRDIFDVKLYIHMYICIYIYI